MPDNTKWYEQNLWLIYDYLWKIVSAVTYW